MPMISKIYALVQYILISVSALYLLMNASTLSVTHQLSIAVFVILSSINLAWVMENKALAVWFEWAKLASLLLVILLVGFVEWSVLMMAPIALSAVLLCLLQYQQRQQTSSGNKQLG